MKKWVCSVCGYVYEGEQPPVECPVCHVDGSKFKEMDTTKLAAEHEFGIGTKLDPKGNATRAQVAVIIHRFLTK